MDRIMRDDGMAMALRGYNYAACSMPDMGNIEPMIDQKHHRVSKAGDLVLFFPLLVRISDLEVQSKHKEASKC